MHVIDTHKLNLFKQMFCCTVKVLLSFMSSSTLKALRDLLTSHCCRERNFVATVSDIFFKSTEGSHTNTLHKMANLI